MIKFKLAHREIGKNVVAVRVAATVMFRKLATFTVFLSHYLINRFEVKCLTA